MSDVATPPLPGLAGGSVWLVGVGPGDPGLLSLLAFRAIRQADVIIHDDDLDPAIRGLLPATAAVEVLVATDAMPSLAVPRRTAPAPWLHSAGASCASSPAIPSAPPLRSR